MLGCAANCGCSTGLGGLAAAPDLGNFPTVTKILIDYAEDKLARGQPFYIAPNFNSEVLAPPNMGFIAALAAAATAIASVVGVASTVKTNKAVRAATSDADKAALAAEIAPSVAAALKAQGINLPNDLSQPLVQASIFDAFGADNRYLVMGALAAGILLLIMKRR